MENKRVMAQESGKARVSKGHYVLLLFAMSLLLTMLGGIAVEAQQPPAAKAPALRVDYAKRELTAPPVVKQKLQALRQQITAKKYNYTVGYTTAMDLPLEKLAGGKPPVNVLEQAKKANTTGEVLYRADIEARDAFILKNPKIVIPDRKLACTASLAAWDYRKTGKVTGVRDQHACGSCWDFAACAALESSYLIRNKLSIDTAEQQILSCAHVGSCGGSWYDVVFDYFIAHGAAKESDYPYTATDAACKGAVPMPYRAVSHGFVHPEVAIPTPAQIKEALCEHGPLAVGVLATGDFQAYDSGVLEGPPVPLTVIGSDGKTYYNVNHCVLIIGWNDSKQAWLIKNSWGTGWGSECGYGTEKGYIWIKYGCFNVGLCPGWVLAKSTLYVVDPSIFKKYYPVWVPFPPEERIKVRPVNKG